MKQGLIKWASLPLFPSSSGTLVEFYDETDPTWKFASLESALYHSFAVLSPVLLVLLAFAFLYKHLDIPNSIKGRFSGVPVDDIIVEPVVGNGTIEKGGYAEKPAYFASVLSWALLVVALVISILWPPVTTCQAPIQRAIA